jgi:hypothetical protein
VQRLTPAAKMRNAVPQCRIARGVLFGPMVVGGDREDTFTRAELLASVG